MLIREYTPSDFSIISSWWTDQKECSPVEGMMIEDGTFILESDNVPALSLTVFKTQSKEMAYLEGFIKNPVFKRSLEKEAAALWEHCFQYAKNCGYKRLVCYCLVDKLVEKYKRFGMIQTTSNLNSFVRVL
jgi:hypothetical protein